jgi:hypothetical protein
VQRIVLPEAVVATIAPDPPEDEPVEQLAITDPHWAKGLTRKERTLVDSISGDKEEYATNLKSWRKRWSVTGE